jgi:DNA-directed RNA polymerase beta' subunit
MGFIRLACPVTHIWYVNARPNLLSLLLKMPTKYMKKIIYYKAYSPSLGLPEYLSACLSPGGDFFDNEWEYVHTWIAGKQSSEDRPAPWRKLHFDPTPESLGRSRPSTYPEYLSSRAEGSAGRKMPEFPHWLKNTGALGLLNEFQSRNWRREIEKLQQELIADTSQQSPQDFCTDKVNLGNSLSESKSLAEVQVDTYSESTEIGTAEVNSRVDEWAQAQLSGGEEAKRRKNRLRRLKILQTFQKTGASVSSMIFSSLPVLPPDLRPIIQLGPGQIASSDVNDLYRRILIRNNRLKYYLYETHFVEFLVRSEQQLVQLAVDALIENGKTTQVRHTSGQKRLYKSLTERIGGKQGRFRMNLLGKRVDYSGRSVIAVGPRLHVSQCGIPYEMGLELFQAFLLRFLLEFQIAKTLRAAKNILLHNKPLARQLLHRILQSYPVLLNRAPTLHRLGIQAFQPVLTYGRALRLHPLVCPAFNADFDGDQMAVHLPLSPQARIEARVLMLATGNWLASSTGQPNLLPSQDMVLGFYYMTLEKHGYQKGRGQIYFTMHDVFQAYQTGELELHSQIWLKTPTQFTQAYSRQKKDLSQIRFHFQKNAQKYCLTSDSIGRLSTVIQHKKKIQDCVKGSFAEVDCVRFPAKPELAHDREIFVKKRFSREPHQPIEIRLNSSGTVLSMYPSFAWNEDKEKNKFNIARRTTPGRVLLNQIFQKYLSQHLPHRK